MFTKKSDDNIYLSAVAVSRDENDRLNNISSLCNINFLFDLNIVFFLLTSFSR